MKLSNLWQLTLVLPLLVTGTVHAEANDTLKAARAALEARPGLAFDSECLVYTSNDAPLPAEPSELNTESVWIGPDRCTSDSVMSLPDKSGAMAPHVVSRWYWDGERLWGWQELPNRTPRRAAVHEDRNGRRSLVADTKIGAFLEGRFSHNRDGAWAETLQGDPSLKELGKEEIDGHTCLGLSAHTSHGDYEIWVDPEADYAIRRALVMLDAEDMAWGEILGEVQMSKPGRHFESISLEVKNVVVEQIDGIWLPVAGDLETYDTYNDGTFSQSRHSVKRDNIRVAPDFEAEKAFRIDFIEGEKVTYWYPDNVRIHYLWENKTLVPAVDSEVVSSVETSLPETMETAAETGILASLQPRSLVLAEREDQDDGPLGKAAVVLSSFGVAALGLIAFCSRKLLPGMNSEDGS